MVLGSISPELAWLHIQCRAADAIEDHYEESARLAEEIVGRYSNTLAARRNPPLTCGRKYVTTAVAATTNHSANAGV